MTNTKSTTLPLPQVNYLLNRITQIENQKVTALQVACRSDVRRDAAVKIVSGANPEHVKNSLLVALGYAVPSYRRTGDSLAQRIHDAANKAANQIKTNKQVLKIHTEATRLRDVIMLGGQPNELAKILSDFAAFEA